MKFNFLDKEFPLTHKQFKETVFYNKKTGVFKWKKSVSKNTKKFQICGSMRNGYRAISINNVQYLAHRLAWFYVYGEFPSFILDHKDGNRDNNSISNLREASCKMNNHNRKNPKGFYKRPSGYVSTIRLDGKPIYLGFFKTEKEARDAYLDGKKKYHIGVK